MTLRVAMAVWLGAAAMGHAADPVRVDPKALPRVGQVEERFQSFNIEMVEVTGGRFWAPYRSAGAPPEKDAVKLAVPGLDPAAFRSRPPIDLRNARLRKLAAALGPAYTRVSGTWANSTYFHDSDSPAPATPPAGFGGVLTRAQWRGVVEFGKAVDARLVTSFAISEGVRDAQGVWTPKEAQKVVRYTDSIGGKIAAAEFFNEPSIAAMGGAPKGYDAAAYRRDFTVFSRFIRKAAPGMVVLGPGSVGEAGPFGGLAVIPSAEMLAGAPAVDAFSYHFYGGVSKRCAQMGGEMQTTPEAALSEQWLARTDKDLAYYTALRDRFVPGKPIWLTETGETACGGNPWASSFVDSFRYLDQMGRLARAGVQVVAHNTLAASDYGLIDEATLEPRPNYWSALLWRNLMGRTVLDAGKPEGAVHVYAHCLRGVPGGVAVLAINTDRGAGHELAAGMAGESYTLTSRHPLESEVELNGRELKLGAGDRMPEMKGSGFAAGVVKLGAESITFLAFPRAGNGMCK